MTEPLHYHSESRTLQHQFDSVRLADRVAEVHVRQALTEADLEFIGRQRMVFLATADAHGSPECSYKGGDPGFVRVLDPHTLVLPSYNGNGMFLSAGNLRANPQVGLLFIDFEQPQRLRVNGTATVHANDPLLAQYPGAELLLRITVRHVFGNCPRYVPTMRFVADSAYIPRAGTVAPTPPWKTRPIWREVLPADDAARRDIPDLPAA
jgi:predicted pyridoxine 5'-phosphate oxidase superfamily flavin-nucleotide-binding protein